MEEVIGSNPIFSTLKALTLFVGAFLLLGNWPILHYRVGLCKSSPKNKSIPLAMEN
jgi:hypothetical protein